MKHISILFFLSFLLFACGSDGPTSEVASEDSAAETAEDPSPEPMADFTAAPERTDGVTVSTMPATHAFPNASIDNMTYSNGKFNFVASNYDFGVQTPDADQIMCANSDKGQHIHFILDNEPYEAKYEPTFERKIDDGEHYLLTFLSRSYHQSIKDPSAARILKVTAEGGNFTKMENIADPMLFYSRPKGTYRGKKATENVMIDFYPVNAPVGEGYAVLAELDGEPLGIFGEWKSYYLNGMDMGEHTLQLTLVDADGATVDTPLNPVSRTFTLEDLPTGE